MAAPQSEYEKAHYAYRELVKKTLAGDGQAKADKVKAMNDIRSIEREAARAGQILSANYKGERVSVSTRETESKRSLQEAYCRKFDADKTVMIGGKEQTLREYHRKRLLGSR